jgi:tripartite-type tricarboxylate transporter receptor subunit TctC
MKRLKVVFAIAAVLLLGGLQNASAQDYPVRSIKILVGIGAGGITDITMRLYAEVVSKNVGQSIIIENRAGGGGAIAAAAVQSAPPDGYTLIAFYGSQVAAMSAMQQGGYDAAKGLQPITLLCENITFIAVPATSPVNTMAELLALGKTKPGGLIFGSPGVGTPSHFLAARIVKETNTPTRFVHYRGGPPMLTDLLAERLDFALPSFTLANAFIAEKKLKVLAIDSPTRLPGLPDVPTLTEVGLGAAKVANWIGLAAPPGTPPAIIHKLNEEFRKAAGDPELKKKLAVNGTPIKTGTPEEMERLLAEEIKNTKELVDELGIRP